MIKNYWKECLLIVFVIWMLAWIAITGIANAQDFPTLRNSVVSIESAGRLGSGAVIGKDMVITAAHVVGDSKTLMVTFYNRDISILGTVVKKDKDQDWALISVPTGKIYSLPLNCNMPIYGESVSTIGFPLGYPWLLTIGYVASDVLSQLENNNGSFIFLDIRLNHGNSGGPVFDKQGRVIGLAVAGTGPKNGEGETIGIMSPLFKFCKELRV